MIDPEDQSLFETLILEGALVIKGVDSESGEIVYSFTDKLKKLAPELYEGYLQMIHNSIMSLWEKGLVDMDVTLSNPLVKPTEKALRATNWDGLNETERQTIRALLDGFRETL